MSIILPSGIKKQQIHQGIFRNENTLDDLFSNITPDVFKVALAPPSPTIEGDPTVSQALNQGNMRGNNLPQNTAGPADSMPSSRGVQPNGSGKPGGMSPFLAPSGSKEEQNEARELLNEKVKLRQAAGGGFMVNLRRSKEGAFEVELLPPQGYKIPNPDEFVQALMRAVDGEAEDISDPDPRSGAMRIVYKSRQIGPAKVVKK